MNNCLDCWLCRNIGKNISCAITGGLYIAGVTKCKKIVTDEDVKAVRNEVDTERVNNEPLTCANCFFASKSDIRVFPAGISSSITLPGGLRYCPKRDTRVPGSLDGCELHSERKKDTESNSDEVNSLDSTIDECFREMERLIGDMEFPDKSEIGIKFDQHGCPVPIFLPTIEQLRKTVTYQQSSPEERLKMEERLASDRRKSKRTPEGKARHLLDRMGIEGAFDFTSGSIVELAELISEVDQLRKGAVITKRLRAERDALRVCNERLKKNNDKLRDENEILQQEVALLKSKMKKCSTDFAAVNQANDQLCMELDMIDMDLAAHKALNMDLKEKLELSEEKNSSFCAAIDLANHDIIEKNCLIMALEEKISRAKKDLSGKWRLLEVGERINVETDEFYDSHTKSWISIRNLWSKVSDLDGVKKSYLLMRRKITI